MFFSKIFARWKVFAFFALLLDHTIGLMLMNNEEYNMESFDCLHTVFSHRTDAVLTFITAVEPLLIIINSVYKFSLQVTCLCMRRS